MSLGIIITAVIALVAAAFVISPLMRADAAEAERVVAAQSEIRDLRSRHEMLLGSLKDLEEDRGTGKLDDADYRQGFDKLSGDAVDVMKQLDELTDEQETKMRAKTLKHPSSGQRARNS